MAKIDIRPAQQGDETAVAALLGPGDAEHAAALPHVFNDCQTRLRARALMLNASREDAALLLATKEDVAVGLICLELHQGQTSPGEEKRRYAWILSIDVLPRHRRHGVGRALIAAGEAWAKDQGASHLEFDVWEFNQGALAFYRALGYAPISRMLSKPL